MLAAAHHSLHHHRHHPPAAPAFAPLPAPAPPPPAPAPTPPAAPAPLPAVALHPPRAGWCAVVRRGGGERGGYSDRRGGYNGQYEDRSVSLPCCRSRCCRLRCCQGALLAALPVGPLPPMLLPVALLPARGELAHCGTSTLLTLPSAYRAPAAGGAAPTTTGGGGAMEQVGGRLLMGKSEPCPWAVEAVCEVLCPWVCERAPALCSWLPCSPPCPRVQAGAGTIRKARAASATTR